MTTAPLPTSADARLLTCTASCFLAIGLLIPTVPRYLTGPLDAGTGTVGVSLAITGITAVLVRPFAGRLADRVGRRTTTCTGALALAAASLGLLAADSLSLFLACRIVAGAGEALTYVGLAAASSDHDRPNRAINHFSVAVNTGLLVGPVIAEKLYALAGFSAVWVLAALAAGIAAALSSALPVTTSAPKRSALIHRAGIRPGLGYLASVWGYTAFTAFLPLHVATLGGGDSGHHFLIYGAVLIGIRLIPHRLPPRIAATTALIVTTLGLALLALWPSTAGALCAAAVIGTGQGLGLPAFLGIAVTGLPMTERGSAVATTTAFFDLGFLSAALALGALAQTSGLAGGFAVAALVSAAAVPLVIPLPSRRRTS